jgi:hypothetical protein
MFGVGANTYISHNLCEEILQPKSWPHTVREGDNSHRRLPRNFQGKSSKKRCQRHLYRRESQVSALSGSARSSRQIETQIQSALDI